MNKTFTIQFYPKKPKNYVNGNMPIYMRLTIDRERIEMATKRACDPKKWNRHTQRVTGVKEEIRRLNNYLDVLQAKVYGAEKELTLRGEPITATAIQNLLTGRTKRQHSILEVYAYHNKQFEELVTAGEFAKGTLKKFRSTYNSLQAFIQWKFGLNHYPIGYYADVDQGIYSRRVAGDFVLNGSPFFASS